MHLSSLDVDSAFKRCFYNCGCNDVCRLTNERAAAHGVWWLLVTAAMSRQGAQLIKKHLGILRLEFSLRKLLRRVMFSAGTTEP